MKLLLALSLVSSFVFSSSLELYFADRAKVVYPKVRVSTSKLQWLEVKVPTNKATLKSFYIMSRPVTQKEFYGYGSDESVEDIDFEMANNFCIENFTATPSNVYIFEYALRDKRFTLSQTAKYEIISPVDYEDMDEAFYQDGDHLEFGDGETLILYKIKSGKYLPKAMSKRVKSTSFRCYKN